MAKPKGFSPRKLKIELDIDGGVLTVALLYDGEIMDSNSIKLDGTPAGFVLPKEDDHFV